MQSLDQIRKQAFMSFSSWESDRQNDEKESKRCTIIEEAFSLENQCQSSWSPHLLKEC